MSGYTPDRARWQRLAELFDRAIELDADSRRQLLERIAAEDPELHVELHGLLAADATSGVLNTAGGEAARARMGRELRDQQGGNDPVGQRIGAYRIERLLARGGMGRVFFATRAEGEFEQRVALKLLRPELVDDLARRRFLEERRVLARLSHPNIARLYDGGLGPDGEPWYAMEYVDGAALTQWCDARKLPVSARIRLFGKVCDAVDFAHRHLVIHRDLKPGNILVNQEGEPKLLDFGIAKLLSEGSAETRSETRLMTPEYAAPEQLRGEAVSTASDVYALGAVLFELLTGLRAFPDPLASREPPSASRACRVAGAEAESVAAARTATPKQLRARLQGDLDRIIRTALDPDPARRYRSVGALAEDLRLHLSGQPISLRNDHGYRAWKFVKRHRFGVSAGCAAALALAATTAIAVWQAHLANLHARNASEQARVANTVKDFMVAVFASADPAQYPGTGPTARELLDAGAQRVRVQFRGDPAIESTLTHALAQSYAGIGAYQRALPLARRTLEMALKTGGASSQQALDANIEYAEVLLGAGQVQRAHAQAGEVLRQTRDAAGAASVRAHLLEAESAFVLERVAESEKESRRALALAQRMGANGYFWQAEAWYKLSRADLEHGDLEAGQKALEQAAALYTRSKGGTAPQTIDARVNLIFILVHSGHLDEAISRYAQLIEQERRILGPAHPQLAQSLAEYARLLGEAGRLAQARSVARQAHAALDVAAGMSAINRADAVANLALLADTRGDFIGAQRSFEENEQRALALGSDAPLLVAHSRWLQASIAGERGAPDAIARLDALRAQKRSVYFTDELDWPAAWLAGGDPARALQRYRELSAAPSAAMHRSKLLVGQGIALTELGRYSEARTVLSAVLSANSNPDHAMQDASARLWRGWSMVRAGRAAAGLPDIESALAWRRTQLGEDSYYTGEALLAHAEALAATGQRPRALLEQKQAQDIFAAQLLPGHVLRLRAAQPLPSMRSAAKRRT